MKTNWQIQPSRRAGAGFTLIELLIVIAIIAILAALTMGAFKYAGEAAARNRTTAAMTAIKGALERYKEKFGEYPDPVGKPDDEKDANGVYLVGSKMLYQAITGDGNDMIRLAGGVAATPSDGKTDDTELENVIEGSLPKSMVFKYDNGYYLIDGFARPFQYDCAMTGNPPVPNPQAINPTFDIWSFGNYEQGKPSVIAYDAVTKKDETKTGAWIKNW